jgi:hypothetical protein
VPPPKLFAYFNPILLNVEPLTLLWLNAFALNLQRSVKLLSVEQTDPPYLDVKIEAIMFRVSIWAIFRNFLYNMVILVVEFSREGYKIRKVLVQKSISSKRIILFFWN